MAKKSKGPAAAAAAAVMDETSVSSPQGSAHGSEGGGEKEGAFLLGQPTWEDAGDGRWRCVETGHELPEREKEAYARSRACRLALVDHAVAHKKPPLNAFKPHPEHKSYINVTNVEKLEEQMASGEMADVEAAKSNEVAKKSKSRKKDKKKTNVASPLPREPKPEMDDSDDSDFWAPPVGSRWDDDDGKDRWQSSPGKKDSAKDEYGSGDDGSGENDKGNDDDMADKDDAESRELASSRTKRMSLEAVGPSSFASRKKKPKKEQ
nr:unnamed protein product [Digitaria exilis]